MSISTQVSFEWAKQQTQGPEASTHVRNPRVFPRDRDHLGVAGEPDPQLWTAIVSHCWTTGRVAFLSSDGAEDGRQAVSVCAVDLPRPSMVGVSQWRRAQFAFIHRKDCGGRPALCAVGAKQAQWRSLLQACEMRWSVM